MHMNLKRKDINQDYSVLYCDAIYSDRQVPVYPSDLLSVNSALKSIQVAFQKRTVQPGYMVLLSRRQEST